ncbi:MAG: potassium channel family protein [Actinomycetota bacterium]|nr:potassium channel family protein [Actinomycetota bacterium]
MWILGLWAGWVLVFASDPRALGLSSGPGFADWTGRIWFVSYTMFTVGNGDFTPADGAWQVVSGLVAATGMSLVTLAVTYLLNVLTAVVGKRAYADQVHGLGRTAEELVLAGWNGHDLHPLDRQLTELASQLSRITQQYLSYPVLQYYHAAAVAKSPVKAAAVLDDALTLLRFGVAPAARPDPAALTSARSAVQSLLSDTLEAASIRPAPEPPPPPRLEPLRRAGVPVVEEQEFAGALRDLDDRRRTMLGLVRGDGWDWED